MRSFRFIRFAHMQAMHLSDACTTPRHSNTRGWMQTGAYLWRLPSAVACPGCGCRPVAYQVISVHMLNQPSPHALGRSHGCQWICSTGQCSKCPCYTPPRWLLLGSRTWQGCSTAIQAISWVCVGIADLTCAHWLLSVLKQPHPAPESNQTQPCKAAPTSLPPHTLLTLATNQTWHFVYLLKGTCSL